MSIVFARALPIRCVWWGSDVRGDLLDVYAFEVDLATTENLSKASTITGDAPRYALGIYVRNINVGVRILGELRVPAIFYQAFFLEPHMNLHASLPKLPFLVSCR